MRYAFKHFILEHSNSLHNICLKCNEGESDDDIDDGFEGKWVACDTCHRWIHRKCIYEEEQFNDNENEEYFCLLCKNYFHDR